jgi:hypothetical protein
MERFLMEPVHEHGIAFVRLGKEDLVILGILDEYEGEAMDIDDTYENTLARPDGGI